MTISTLPIQVAIASPGTPEARALIAALDDYLNALYPPENNYLLDVNALLAPEVSFVLARRADAVLGCGAIRREGTPGVGYVELKRMYVKPEARGQRIAEAVVAFLENLALADGYRVARLETGSEQQAALRLYERLGYAPITAFGAYRPDPLNVFMEKPLSTPA